MKEYKLDENKIWKENATPSSVIQHENVHSVFIFAELRSQEIPENEEYYDDLAITFLLNSNEIQFQRDDDEERNTGTICQLQIMKFESEENVENEESETNDENEEKTYNIKIIFKLDGRILNFVIPYSYVVFPNDSLLSPETPENFASLLLTPGATEQSDEQSSIIAPSRLKKQLINLYDNLIETPKHIEVPRVQNIAVDKLRHNFVKRPLLPLRVAEIESQMQQNLFDYNLNPITVIEDNGMYDVVDGNQILGAALGLKQKGKPHPSQLKAKIYDKNPLVNPLELALFNESKKNEFPLSYLDKIEIVRKYLEMKHICRDSATSQNPNEVKKIFNHLFPTSTNPRSLQYLVGIDVDTFQKLLKISQKFSKNEICYSKEKECDSKYKYQNIQLLNSDRFWTTVTHGLKINSSFIFQHLTKLSNTYGIMELLEDIKDVPIDLHQSLQNSKITYSKSLNEAIKEFGMPESTTVEQCCFLLSNREIQKQGTTDKTGRTLDSCEKMRAAAKSKIIEFLNGLNSIACEKYDSIPNLETFQFIICFESLNWKDLILPKNCLIFDLHKDNDKKLGRRNISSIWDINIITEEIQNPIDGRLPKLSTLMKVFYYCDEKTEDNEFAFKLFQERVDANNIKTGSEIQKSQITQLFYLAENGAKILIYAPPVEWIEIIAASCLKCNCKSITVVTTDTRIFGKFKSIIDDGITQQWHAKAKTNKRKRISATTDESQPPSPDAPPKPKSRRPRKNLQTPLASSPQSQQSAAE